MTPFAVQIKDVEDYSLVEARVNRSYDDLLTEIEDLREQNRRLRHQLIEMERTAEMDPLAPVYNRRAFVREVGRAQSVLSRYDITSAIIFFDLNRFKSINDQYGHLIGDEIIREVGLVLKNKTRECDMVARLGGDEFGVLLFKVSEANARRRAQALADRISEIKINLPTGEVYVTASWGVSACDTLTTAEQALSRADRDMYKAKKSSG